MRPDLSSLETAIGHAFRNRELLERALTHSSHVHERAVAGAACLPDNERLEFLGDAILGFLISEALVDRQPGYSEGQLSKLKAHIVSAAHLYPVAERLQLGQYLHLGRGEEMSGGRQKKALLSDAVEALIAALFLDAGLETASLFIESRVVGALHAPEDALNNTITDHKSALQEMAQALKLPPPRYVTVAEEGPEHSKTFTVEVRVGKEWVSQAQGFSKKSAGQRAAQQILQQLTEWGR